MGREDLAKKTLPELQQIGKEIGLKSVSKLRKMELIEAIHFHQEQKEVAPIKKITTYGFELEKKKPLVEIVEQKNAEQEQKNAEQEQKNIEETKEQKEKTLQSLDSGLIGEGILEVMPDGYGFLRAEIGRASCRERV